jgi:thioredoxin 1
MNQTWKVAIVVVLIVSVIAVLTIKRNKSEPATGTSTETTSDFNEPAQQTRNINEEQTKPIDPDSEIAAITDDTAQPDQLVTEELPMLLDIGSNECIPCKMMAPILEELKTEYADKFKVEFMDVRKDPMLATVYNIRLIPTQIFFDASGKELFRHEGFYSKEDILNKWKELGTDLSEVAGNMPAFERLTPAKNDDRPKDTICYMCDGDIIPKTVVTVQTDKGPVRVCSPHCYFIMYSCLTEDKTVFEKKVSVADWSTGESLPVTSAVFIYGQDEFSGRPWVKAFIDRDVAVKERSRNGDNILTFALMQEKELFHRCGFCDRAVYPKDVAEVIIEGGVHTWGCCSHCALGVAARTGKDIEVREKDRLTGQKIVVKTLDGKVASLEPPSAVAWFGQRQKPDGTWVSAGCFHQGFFTNADNLKKWVEKNPYETGRLISISQALADKMKLSPEQIQKACKIGECVPK